ncbi:MAG TPA: hypothetical protein VL443_20375 [Cyclobacteriaceae bacterium]|nr:hypothetical protein [Cyclobacteriaceae bacterium]
MALISTVLNSWHNCKQFILCLLLSISLFLISFLTVTTTLAQTTEGTTAASPSWQEQQRAAINTFYKLDQSNNYTESLTYADMNVLPMGIRRTVGNMEVTIAVSDIIWQTTHSELTLFARVKLPQDDKTLFFGAQGIKFSHEGDIVGDASLVLMGDFTIPINGNTAALTLKGSFDKNTGRGKELTYVSVDCKGFKEMGITAEIEFPESMMSPIDTTGHPMPGRVKGGFKTVVSDWNDILVGVSLPPFEIKGLQGFIFSMKDAVFDFSDLRNDPTIAYPEGYQQNYMIPGNPTLWRGVFIRDLSIILPEQFAKRQKKERVSLRAHNMLLDNNGVSGIFTAAGILPISAGSASGWRFSVDAFSLALEANRLTEARFSGLIGLPVAEKSNLGYDAIITADNEYLLKVSSIGKTKFDVFHAEAELLPNSYVQLKVKDGQFKPEAMLHGSLNLAARVGAASDSTGKKIAEFKGIEFRSLHLKTDAPRLTAEYFGYKGELKMMNFPISISRIGVRIQEDEIALGMDIKLTLSDNMFSGSTGLEFIGVYKEPTTTSTEGNSEVKSGRWVYDKLKISSIAINAKIAETFSLKAELIIMNDDPIYGDGYAGSLTMTFDKVLKGFKVEARAMFGRKDFRYWFVDGRVSFGTSIPVFPPVGLTGFGGGVYYRMKRDGADVAASPTGCRYVPDENTGIGVKASVLFNVGSEAAVNGEASFEIAFSRSGGLNFIGFYGFAKFVGKIPGTENVEKFVKDKAQKVADLEKKFIAESGGLQKLDALKQFEPNKAASAVFEPSQKPGEDGGFAAAVGIQYDFTQSSLHATFDLYVNTLGGMLRGTASGNRAGWAVLHIDPHEWYIHMGTPTDRLGLKLGIAGVSIETGSYLMLGSRIPGSPPPPKQVADILGVDMAELDYMRDLNALGDGRGFAFGASLKVATGDMTFLILYANFEAGIGFDIMLKDYQDMQCKGRSGKLGIDGWYANGQSYVYLQGELGVKVNLWFLKTKIPIIKGAAAALMQAQLPNPVFIKGYLGVQFDLLGGLVKGKCRFKMTIGEKCELVVPGSSPIEMKMISDLTPRTNASDVDVFAAPQAAFNMRVGVPFDVEDDQGPKTYRIQLNDFSLTDEESKLVEGKLVWSQMNDNVSFYSHEVLPPTKKLKASVKVGFEQWQNGKWNVVYTSGKKAEEIMEVTFTTGTAPDVIPMTNIEYVYPVVEQKFFLKDETKNGYIQLKRGQSYLFSTEYKHEIQVTGADGVQSASFTYVPAANKINYTMPELTLHSNYSVNVVTLSKGDSTSQSASDQQTDLVNTADDAISVTNRQAGSVVRADVGKSLLGYTFSTGQYGTFREKINTIQKGSAVAGRLSSDVINLQYEIAGGEPFEPMELQGSSYSGGLPLVEATAAINDAYYQEDMYPLIYKNYPVEGITLDRNVNDLGFPPIKAIPLSTSYLTEVENNNYDGIARHRFPYIYNLPMIYKEDFVFLQSKIVNRFLGTSQQSKYDYIINGYYKFIRSGNYTIRLQYTTPDGTKGSNAEFDYYNFIK